MLPHAAQSAWYRGTILSTNFDSGVEMWTRQLLCIADAVGFPIDGQAGFQLTGDLTVHGVTREVTWQGVATFTKDQVATKSVGGRIAASEFMNEPTFGAMGGAPKGYDAASYGRDVEVFRSFLRKTAPDTLFLGPGRRGD
jgi:hypothetical protein